MTKQPSQHQLEKYIRKCAQVSSNIAWTRHAQQRMKGRKINQAMALDVLRMGALSRPPEPSMTALGLTCRMERFVAGMQVAVVVYVEYPLPSVIVVTVIDVNGD